MHPNYFEGVLQLRNPTPEVLAYVRKAITDHGKVWIAKEQPTKDGTDLFLSHQRFIQQLGKQLAQRFCGQLKISSRLFSRDSSTSKNLYRISVLFRLCPFAPGDQITIAGNPSTILSIKARVRLKDARTGAIFSLPIERVMTLCRQHQPLHKIL